MPIELIAELATNHGGDVDLMREMVEYALAGGATMIKGQAYLREAINPNDPQAAWLAQSCLKLGAHQELFEWCAALGVTYFVSVFEPKTLEILRDLTTPMRTFKIASSEAASTWWEPKADERWIVSIPWGAWGETFPRENWRSDTMTMLAAIPLYPTPLEAVGRVNFDNGMGWSDHCVGLAGCQYAIAHGARTVEVHVSIPGKGRNCVFDKTQEDLKRLREWLEQCETITSGVSQTFRERWVR